MRYIDADKLKSEFDYKHIDMNKTTACVHHKNILEIINQQPTADVVEVVRCNDCIYYETCNLRSSHWWKGGYTVDIEFCSFGERKEE